MNIKSSVEKLKKIQKENNLSNYKNSILNHIRISENSQNLMGKSINKNIYDLGDIINNLKSIKSHSINIKEKNNLIANINKNYRNIGINSIDKINKKSIEKEKEINNNDFYISSKTFNKNDLSLNDKISNHRNKILKKEGHDIARNIENMDIDKLINKFKQYKLINKNNEKNNININLNINNIQNIQNIQNIETIDINKLSPTQRIFLVKNDIFNSYINNGKTYKDKIMQDKHFQTLQNLSHDKNNTNIIPITTKTFRNADNSSKIKNKLNSIRDNLFNKKSDGKKNIKLNYNILNNNPNINTNNINNNNNHEFLPKFSTFETLNNNKRNYSLKNNYNTNNYIYDFSNENYDNKTIINETIKNTNANKKIYFRVLSSKKKKFISFGEILKKEKENELLNNKLKDNNIILKLTKSKNNNPNTILPKNLNAITNYNSNNSKPKNFFNHKIIKINAQKEINNNFYTIVPKNKNNNINNNTFNLIHSPHDQGLKLIVKNKKFKGEKIINDNKPMKDLTDNNYMNYRPEYVKEDTDEILINLLIEEYLFKKKKKLILNTDILNNYGINSIIRSCLIDSFVGLQETFQICDKTLFITIKLFDNYLSSIIAEKDTNEKIEDTDLDMIIVSCFLIASKMEESFIYHLTDYLSILSDKYTTKHLMTMEYNILKCFNFEAFEPNILDFFEIFSSFYELDDKLKKKGINILFAILLNIDLSEMPSSIIAFSVLYLLINKDFNIIMNRIDGLFYYIHKWSDWSQRNYNDKKKNEIYSKYMDLIAPLKKEKDIKDISDMILYFMENIPKTEFFNAAKKIEKI